MAGSWGQLPGLCDSDGNFCIPSKGAHACKAEALPLDVEQGRRQPSAEPPRAVTTHDQLSLHLITKALWQVLGPPRAGRTVPPAASLGHGLAL